MKKAIYSIAVTVPLLERVYVKKKKNGRLIVDATLFKGDHKFFPVPVTGELDYHFRDGRIEEEKTGYYTLLMANCRDNGRKVKYSGSLILKSKHGYLPGERFYNYIFDMIMYVIYLVVFFWYAHSMYKNKESTIQIQKWILTTIILGMSEGFFKGGDSWIWNSDGTRMLSVAFTGEIIESNFWYESLLLYTPDRMNYNQI